MRKNKLLSLILLVAIVLLTASPVSALEIKKTEMDIESKSAVLMDVATGTVLFSKNMNEALPPASVTKVMTLLLVFEAIDKGSLRYDEMLTVSENAASMGGSQVFLEPGETMSVDELLKCVIISSANDAALTLAERVGGSEEAFVELMNKRASELGMKNTYFENVTGLDDDVTRHLTSAYDIALMSKELLKHEKVMKYTTIWMDTIRNGQFGLSNTNRLVKFYRGITGLKTGYTSGAGYCISASAERNGLHLVAVVMGAKTSSERNAIASKLLDYGFANYCSVLEQGQSCGSVRVLGGMNDSVSVRYSDFFALENAGVKDKIFKEILLPDSISAPVKKGEKIGKVVYKIDDKIIGENPIFAESDVEKIDFWHYFVKGFENLILN